MCFCVHAYTGLASLITANSRLCFRNIMCQKKCERSTMYTMLLCTVTMLSSYIHIATKTADELEYHLCTGVGRFEKLDCKV